MRLEKIEILERMAKMREEDKLAVLARENQVKEVMEAVKASNAESI